jgi:hypothetical protein
MASSISGCHGHSFTGPGSAERPCGSSMFASIQSARRPPCAAWSLERFKQMARERAVSSLIGLRANFDYL